MVLNVNPSMNGLGRKRPGQWFKKLLDKSATVEMRRHTINFDINSLPSEILGEIFFHYIHSRRRYVYVPEQFSALYVGRVSAWPVKMLEEDPIILGHVCSYWRALSQSIPLLWSTLHVTNIIEHHGLFLLDHWLALSKDRPLDITVHQNTDERPEVLEHLFAHRHRWRRIELELSGHTPIDLQTSDVYPLLESVAITHTLSRDPAALSLSQLLATSPSLRHIELKSNRNHSPIHPRIQFGNLQSIIIRSINQQSLIRALSSCASLELLNIGEIREDPHITIDRRRRITLPNLKRLTFGRLWKLEYQLFDLLTVPSLQELTIHWSLQQDHIGQSTWESFSSMVAVSDCRIRILNCHIVAMSEEEDWALCAFLREECFQHLFELVVRSTPCYARKPLILESNQALPPGMKFSFFKDGVYRLSSVVRGRVVEMFGQIYEPYIEYL